MSQVTQILLAVERGDAKAANELLPLVYQELRRLAAHKMSQEAPGHTLQPTALVHEAWLRLAGDAAAKFQNRAHFFGAAAEAMRRILVDRAREKKALKRGGNLERVDLDAVELPSPMPDDELLALDEALDRLATVDTRAAQMVKLCFFVGLTQAEAAGELSVSLATVERIWGFARAWLCARSESKRQERCCKSSKAFLRESAAGFRMNRLKDPHLHRLIVANADRIIDLLHEAKARPAGPDRERFLAEACRDDAALKEQILSLLAADANEGDSDFLKISRMVRPSIPPAEKPGDRIGGYKLLEQIGEGGCGVVYMAEQEEPVRRRVALKVIKLGMDTKQVIARFEAERQALAMMDHPNIAKIYDAGATGAPVAAGILPAVEPGFQLGGKGRDAFERLESSNPAAKANADPGGRMPPSTAGETPAATLSAGRPYFVMELVRGIKITDYCDQNNLPTNERLELFIQVCQAIQHAHQKGIIHRDIKPSNILVTLHDDVAVPKLIDFGIAKATVGQLTDKTVFTAFAQFVGTPAYMSQEQAQMSGLDIDTRSDIYSLGVLLYELLTGHTPFDAKELLAAGMDEMRRKIRAGRICNNRSS